ncbi:hypothetical protein EBI_25791 [Enterocytozoon bieneusi H348]|nr:hypothetical protein EBI_25791 [Enterocytozoon bieneusi H348]|eukprot:XP_002651125.1 hypothetical protein EBI_25791 [Enterocytozoon bieneusi H348]
MKVSFRKKPFAVFQTWEGETSNIPGLCCFNKKFCKKFQLAGMFSSKTPGGKKFSPKINKKFFIGIGPGKIKLEKRGV